MNDSFELTQLIYHAVAADAAVVVVIVIVVAVIVFRCGWTRTEYKAAESLSVNVKLSQAFYVEMCKSVK